MVPQPPFPGGPGGRQNSINSVFFHVRRACAPMLRSRKSLICYGFVHLLVSRGENKAFGAFARWSLPLMQAKRNFCSLKLLILRRRPAIPWFHCRQCFVSGFVFSRFFNFSYALSLSLFVYLYRSSRSRSPFALAHFSGAAAAAAGRGSPPPPGAAW